MWSETQGPAMMGLHVMANKRKFDEMDASTIQSSKFSRVDDSVRSAVRGVTADLDDWDMESTSSVLASSLLRSESALGDEIDDEEDDEDDDDEEEDDEEEKNGKYFPSGRAYPCASGCYTHSNGYYGVAEDQGVYANGLTSTQYASRQQQYQPRYWSGAGVSDTSTDYYGQDSIPQQTIRCDENGKSYLDLGSSSSSRYLSKCCDGSRTNWCGKGPGAACYRQRRLAVFNISMCKLGRYRQFPDPSLLRSVLICNTLRYIEREMEQEGCVFNSSTGTVQSTVPPLPPAPSLQQCSGSGESDGSYHQYAEVTDSCYSPAYRGIETFPSSYEQNLRDLQASGRATPFPAPVSATYDTDSGMGDEDFGRGINWGSVLSLSSQSDLDPLNNNELYPPPSPSYSSVGDGLLGDVDLSREFDDFLPSWKLTPVSADDVLKSVPPSEFRQSEGELDLMRVLVGTS